MGMERITAQNLKVVLVDAARNVIGLNGAVPGGKGSLVVLKETRKQ
jgi:large subunit ribosomal protein L3